MSHKYTLTLKSSRSILIHFQMSLWIEDSWIYPDVKWTMFKVKADDEQRSRRRKKKERNKILPKTFKVEGFDMQWVCIHNPTMNPENRKL